MRSAKLFGEQGVPAVAPSPRSSGVLGAARAVVALAQAAPLAV
jgi:hypothetical protein